MRELHERFAAWAVIEIMGHKRLAGFVTEQTIGGTAFLRVDVPDTKREARWSKLLDTASIYAITPCTEQIARAVAEEVGRYEPPVMVDLLLRNRLQAGTLVARADEDEDEDEEFSVNVPAF